MTMKTDVATFAPSCLGLTATEGPCDTAGNADPRARRLARIEAALDRMEAGRYGFCLSCEGRIALDRLEADPAEAVCEICDEGEDA